MSYLAKYTNTIDLKKMTECKINEKSFLEIFSNIALQKVKLIRSTDILGYIKYILPSEEYNNTELYIKDHKSVLKKFDIKNNIHLIYLLFTFATFADEYETSIKAFIEEIFQEQVAQIESTELTNDTLVST